MARSSVCNAATRVQFSCTFRNTKLGNLPVRCLPPGPRRRHPYGPLSACEAARGDSVSAPRRRRKTRSCIRGGRRVSVPYGRHNMCPRDSELAQLSDATPLPQSLKLLHLFNTSAPSAFPGIQLPPLQTVRMCGCGLHAAALFDSLRSHASQMPAMQSLDMGDTVATSQHPTDWIWRNHYQRPLAVEK